MSRFRYHANFEDRIEDAATSGDLGAAPCHSCALDRIEGAAARLSGVAGPPRSLGVFSEEEVAVVFRVEEEKSGSVCLPAGYVDGLAMAAQTQGRKQEVGGIEAHRSLLLTSVKKPLTCMKRGALTVDWVWAGGEGKLVMVHGSIVPDEIWPTHW